MKKYQDIFWGYFKMILLACLIVFILRGFIFIPLTVEGNSMEKTLMQGDHIIVEKISTVKRFDIIVFQLPNGATYIKRVIGMPGDQIEYKEDQLYVNNKKVSESFLKKNNQKEPKGIHYTIDFDGSDIMGTKTIPKDSYFVLGDNRRVSKDSRSFGVVKSDMIYGKARMVYYPFSHLKLLR